MKTAINARSKQVPPNPAGPIGSITTDKAGPDTLAGRFVAPGSGAGRTIQPGMEARAGDAQRVA